MLSNKIEQICNFKTQTTSQHYTLKLKVKTASQNHIPKLQIKNCESKRGNKTGPNCCTG